ncbi:hypothetical protein LCGC14_1584800 [marine sediment metagenome]|uniref:Uncharacterized protein n=1 Tax=marine sediment metagenome TaxID=412755 RepID=A0A0F9IFY9_9ZZZZ
MAYKISTVKELPDLLRSKHDALGKALLELEPNSDDVLKLACESAEEMVSVHAYVYNKSGSINGCRFACINDNEHQVVYIRKVSA